MLERAVERQRQNWVATGVQQGFRRGIEQGLKLGMDRIAKTLLAKGMEKAWVAEVTGLSLQELLFLESMVERHHAHTP